MSVAPPFPETRMLVTDRRLLLAALSASLLPQGALTALAQPAAIRLGAARPFSFELLAARAKKKRHPAL